MSARRLSLLAGVLLAALGLWVAVLPGSTKSEPGKPIVVALEGNLATTLDPANVGVLVALERRIASLAGVQTVVGPGSFVRQAVVQADRAIGQKVAALHRDGLTRRRALNEVLVRYGYVGAPAIDNESFVGQLIFGSGTRPEPRLGYLFPDSNHALVLVRLRPELDGARARAVANEVGQVVKAAPLQGTQALVAGVPVITTRAVENPLWLTLLGIAALALATLSWRRRRLALRPLHSVRSLSL